MKNYRNFKIVLFVVVFIVAIGFVVNTGAVYAKDGRKVIKLRAIAGHPAQAVPWVRMMKSYLIPELEKRVLEQTTDYELKIQENYGGSVAALGEVLEAVESGIGDIGMVVWVFEMSKLHPHTATAWFPFSPRDPMVVLKAWRKTWEQYPFLEETFAKYNQKSIAFPPIGCYEIVSNFPITKLEDVKGHKLAHGGPMVPWIEAIGAVGVQSRLNEAYTSMQTGVYDGWLMEPNATVGLKMYEPSPYYTLVGLGAAITQCVTINLDTWNKLPKEVQKIVTEVGRDYGEATAKATANVYYKKIVFMATQGVTIRELPKKERVRFAEAMNKALVSDVMAKESEKMGFSKASEMSKFYIQTISDLGYEWPWVPQIN